MNINSHYYFNAGQRPFRTLSTSLCLMLSVLHPDPSKALIQHYFYRGGVKRKSSVHSLSKVLISKAEIDPCLTVPSFVLSFRRQHVDINIRRKHTLPLICRLCQDTKKCSSTCPWSVSSDKETKRGNIHHGKSLVGGWRRMSQPMVCGELLNSQGHRAGGRGRLP